MHFIELELYEWKILTLEKNQLDVKRFVEIDLKELFL